MSYRLMVLEMLANPNGVRLAEMRERTGASSDTLREVLLGLRDAGIAKPTHAGGSLSRWALVEHLETAKAAAEAMRQEATILRRQRSVEFKRKQRALKRNAVLSWAESDPVQRVVPAANTTFKKRGPSSVWDLAA